jgi:hypothetical protein
VGIAEKVFSSPTRSSFCAIDRVHFGQKKPFSRICQYFWIGHIKCINTSISFGLNWKATTGVIPSDNRE